MRDQVREQVHKYLGKSKYKSRRWGRGMPGCLRDDAEVSAAGIE